MFGFVWIRPNDDIAVFLVTAADAAIAVVVVVVAVTFVTNNNTFTLLSIFELHVLL